MNNSSQVYANAVKRNGYAFFTNSLVWIQMTISYFVLMAPPIGARIFRDQLRLQQHKNRLEKENMKLQMDFLKAQIHPHFLFNTLNNIYSLIAHHESEKSAEMVSGLSSLLRYALYEGKAEFISLEKEIEMLKDYIALEEARTDEIDLEIEIPSHSCLSKIKLPPFLLLPLVENAFKHGVNSQFQKSSLKIKIEITPKSVHLFVQNNFDVEFRKKNEGGLGLLNLKKRLAYYYKDCHKLTTEEKENIFTATLKLPRSCPQSKVSS
ncbi:MAG TPA: histidine kinase [Chitinophagaceae bacterium]|nr:histidine kinase [Chitinophagaceae bacterium]